MEGTQELTKAEKQFRRALDGYEKSLGKDNKTTKTCARNLAVLLESVGRKIFGRY